MSRMMTLLFVAIGFTLLLLITGKNIESAKYLNATVEPCEPLDVLSQVINLSDYILDGRRAEPGTYFDLSRPMWQKFIKENTVVCP